MKNSEAPHINKDSSPLAVFKLFFTDIFPLLVEQTNLYYKQHLDRQAGPSRRLSDITMPEIMTFTALALQKGYILKDTLHDYWSRLKQMHTPFYSETKTQETDFYTYCGFCTLRTIHGDATQARNMTTMENKDCL